MSEKYEVCFVLAYETQWITEGWRTRPRIRFVPRKLSFTRSIPSSRLTWKSPTRPHCPVHKPERQSSLQIRLILMVGIFGKFFSCHKALEILSTGYEEQADCIVVCCFLQWQITDLMPRNTATPEINSWWIMSGIIANKKVMRGITRVLFALSA